MSAVSSLRLLISENKVGLICVGSLGVMVIGALSAAEHYSNQATELSGKNKVLAGRIVEIDSQRLRALGAAEQALGLAKVADDKVKSLQEKLAKTPMPPKPQPAPQTTPELETVIVSFGFTPGLSVLDSTGPSSLGRPDALKVYEWASQAARVAPLEDRISAQGAVIGGLEESVAAQVKVFNFTNDALAKTTTQLTLTQEQAKNFEQIAKATAKKAALQKWLYAGGALITGYIVAKK